MSLFEKYHDVPMDFADACMVYLGERLSTDGDSHGGFSFEVYRMREKAVPERPHPKGRWLTVAEPDVAHLPRPPRR